LNILNAILKNWNYRPWPCWYGSHTFLTLEVLRIKEHTSIFSFSVIFTFGLAFESFKKFGGASSELLLHICHIMFTWANFLTIPISLLNLYLNGNKWEIVTLWICLNNVGLHHKPIMFCITIVTFLKSACFSFVATNIN